VYLQGFRGMRAANGSRRVRRGRERTLTVFGERGRIRTVLRGATGSHCLPGVPLDLNIFRGAADP